MKTFRDHLKEIQTQSYNEGLKEMAIKMFGGKTNVERLKKVQATPTNDVNLFEKSGYPMSVKNVLSQFTGDGTVSDISKNKALKQEFAEIKDFIEKLQNEAMNVAMEVINDVTDSDRKFAKEQDKNIQRLPDKESRNRMVKALTGTDTRAAKLDPNKFVDATMHADKEYFQGHDESIKKKVRMFVGAKLIDQNYKKIEKMVSDLVDKKNEI